MSQQDNKPTYGKNPHQQNPSQKPQQPSSNPSQQKPQQQGGQNWKNPSQNQWKNPQDKQGS